MTKLPEPKRWLDAEGDDLPESLARALRAHQLARHASSDPSAQARGRIWGGLAAALPAFTAADAAARANASEPMASYAAESGERASTSGVYATAPKPTTPAEAVVPEAGSSTSALTPAASGRALGAHAWWWFAGVGAAILAAAIAARSLRDRSQPGVHPRTSVAAAEASPERGARAGDAPRATPPSATESGAAAEGAAPAGDAPSEPPQPPPARRHSKLSASEPRPARPIDHATSAATPSDITAELTLLSRARRIVASEPARALELTAEHGKRHRFGVLAQEREVLAIEALRRLGHAELATARARRFVRDYPSSAHRVRVSAALEAP